MVYVKKNWGWLTTGMTEPEIVDFEKAKETLEHYEKIYSIVEYASDLNEGMTVLERKIMTNNPTIPMNMYRKASANSINNLFPEMEQYLQAYYDLIDDCAEYPLWQRKIEEDIGGVASFLGIQMEEATRDLNVQSPIYARFDADKQRFFK